MKTYVFVLSAIFVLFGCTDENRPETKADPVRTVEWYKEHKEERKAMRQQCANNPGELEDTPNCINAEEADAAIMGDRSRSKKGVKLAPMKF